MFFAWWHAAAAALLGLLFWATGHLASCLVAARVRQPEVAALGTSIVRVTIGVIVWIYLLFGLACAGWLHAQVVLPIVGVLLIAGVCQRLRTSKAELAAMRRVSAGLWRRLARSVALAVVPGVTLAAIFFLALRPKIGWDDDVYHLTLPKLYLAHGGFRPVPYNVYANWPHNIELLYGLAMMVGDYILAKLVHTLFLLLLVLAVYRICRQHGSRAAALLASLLLLANPVLLFEAEYAYVDIAFAFFFLIAVSCAIDSLRSDDRGALLLSGLCCGALAGVKLSGLAGVLCVLVLVLGARPWRFGMHRLLGVGAALLLPTLLLALPWYVKSYFYTGNPVYPLLFKQLGGREWDASLGQQFSAWQHAIGMGRSLHDYLALPVRVILEGGPEYDHFDGEIGKFWLAAVPLAGLAALRASHVRPYLTCAGVYFVFWSLSSQQLRFLIAALPLLAIASGLTVEWLHGRLQTRKARSAFRAAVGLGAAFSALPVLYPTWQRGLREAQRLVDHGPADRSSVVPEGHAFINAETAPDAKVMLLNTNHGFFLERPYIADSFFEASQMRFLLSQARSQAELSSTLARLGLTHLYVWHRDMGVEYPQVLSSFLDDPRRAKLAYRCADRTCSIYALQPAWSRGHALSDR